MKKFFALFFAIMMIFLSACADKEDKQTSDSTQSSTNEAQKEPKEYITDWNTDLLPEKFPSPPEKAHTFSALKGKAGEGDYAYTVDFTRITFICTEQAFYGFTNELSAIGYNGGVRNIVDGEYYNVDGFKGFWQNGETYVRISNSSPTDNGEYIFTLDVAPCVDNFPEELEEYFLKFNGYSQSRGRFFNFDANGNIIEGVSSFDEMTEPFWLWDFRFSNGFVGVNQTEFEKYFYDLEKSGFEGTISTSTVDGMTVISGDMTKDSGGSAKFGVFMLYNTALKTLDIVYTNDTSLVLN